LAIVGVGCRFPGGVEDVESFWRLLAEGRSGIREVPPNRWDRDRFYHPQGTAPATMVTKWGGFVDNLDQFDAAFWGISPREAVRMDPQQRWMLEVSWEALEDSGTPPAALRGAPVGVFVGVSGNDYAGLQMPNVAQMDVHTISGCTLSIVANRISYLLDLRGPSLSADTACSSALVAVWSACRSIWSGSCVSALAGGVNALLTPEATIGFSKSSMLSPDGQCFAFDSRANGYVRGEGAGAVYIKPLDQALADRDRIYAVIRSAVSNQDGHTSSMTVPSADGQAALLRQAYQEAGLAPGRVVYAEAHGTGTPVGDPIEAAALGRVLGEGRPTGQPCLLGSVKTNIGHLEAGSGIAGLIKAALVLHYDTIPPNRNFETPNPHIPFQTLGLQVAARLQPLPHRNGLPPVTAVNSFGFGGTNAHVVLEQAPPPEDLPVGPRSPRPRVLPISARDDESLRRYVEKYRAFLADPAVDLSEACWSAGARKEHHDHRLVVLGNDAAQMRQRLHSWLHGTAPVEGVVTGRKTASASPPVFVYTGQGAQWWAMGRNLLAGESVVRETLEEIDGLLRPLAGWSLLEEMRRDEAESNIDRTDIAQPAIFAMQVALTRLWESWGVKPARVVGHSVGEVAAAHVAGIHSLPDAVKVIFERSRLQHTTAGQGRMLAVGISAGEARQVIGGDAGRVAIAVFNSPHLVTLSGDRAPLEQIAARLEQAGKFQRWLRIPYAFHTRQMDPIKDELLKALATVRGGPARIPFISTVTGVPLRGERLDAAYWWDNVRRPVLFRAAIAHLIRGKEETFLEIGPHPSLTGAINECLREQGRPGAVFHSLRRGSDDAQELLTNLAGLHVRGLPLEWAAVNQSRQALVRLPHYPWCRESFWLESQQSRESRLTPALHPLLGVRVAAALPTWQVELHPSRIAYLNDHRFWDSVVFPAACYAEIGIAVARLMFPDEVCAVEDLQIKKALFLREEQPPTVQVVFDPESRNFRVHSTTGKETWDLHAQGRLTRMVPGRREVVDLERLRQRLTEEVDHDRYYTDIHEAGYQFGPNFMRLRYVWREQGEAVAEIQVPDDIVPTLQAYHIHPIALDASFQLFRGLKPALGKEDFFLPQSIRRVHLESDNPPAHLWVHGLLRLDDGQSLISDLFIYNDRGETIAQVLGFRVDRVENKRPENDLDTCYYHFRWETRRLHSSVTGSCGFPPASAVVAAARSTIAELYRQGELEQYHQHYAPWVDSLVRQSVQNAWLQLGWRPYPGERFTLEELIDRLGVAPSYHRLVQAQLLDLAEHGWLRAMDDAWEVVQTPQPTDASAAWDAVAAEYPAFASEVALHQRVGPRLAAVLSGEVDPVEVLFPGGSSEHVERFYVEGAGFPTALRLLGKALPRLLSALPERRVLRVLEIGAGTGSLTRTILPLLRAEWTEYLFTDIGPAFLPAARKKFEAYPFVDYRVFDLEKDPRSQGLEPGSIDLILGSLVLHATADLKQVLANLDACLAEDGVLLFMEIFPRRPAWDNTFGLLPGWWRFTDSALRRHSPLMERDAWRALLADCGFRDIGSFGTSVDERESEQAFFFATAPRREENRDRAASVPSAATGRYVVLADRGGTADALIARLEQSGRQVTCVRAGRGFRRTGESDFVVAPETETDLRRVLADVDCPANELAGVIHCWSLDHPRACETSLEQLWAAQHTGVLSAFRLVQAVAAAPPRQFWFVARDVCDVQVGDRSEGLASSPLVGLLRVANNEFHPSRFALIDLDASPAAERGEALYQEVVHGDGELEIAYRAGRRHVIRLDRAAIDRVPIRTCPAAPFRLQTKKAGILTNLSLNEIQRRPPGPDEIEIRVRAGGINFRDVLKALGTYPGAPIDRLWFGDDVAGTVERVGGSVQRFRPGDEVVGMVPYGFQSFVTADARLLWKKPRSMSFEQAATLPTVFFTAHHALIHLARMRAGETILIHAGTGGVGQAAIQIARRLGLEIFATAGTEEKRRLLLELGAHHAMSSRTLEFSDQVMEITGGRGVDAVLNSLAGDFIPKSLSVLAPLGRFLEIGKIDIYKNTRIGLEQLRNNIAYFVIDLSQYLERNPARATALREELSERFAAGDYQPLPHTVYPVTEVVEAFRSMAQGRHVGKNVLSFHAPNPVIGPCTEDAHRFRADATYLITGGAGGFGLELAKWLFRHGARHLVLFSRSGPRDESARQDIEQMRTAGVHVLDFRGDVTRIEDVSRVVERIREEMPPLKGVIHAAMVLDDEFVAALDEARFTAAMGPKLAGAWNLHTATAELPLEHFICLSSYSSVVGVPKQSNYNAGNAFLDALAHHRRARGLPALTVNWGALLGAGFVERNRKTAEFMAKIGAAAFTLEEALSIFSRLTLLDPIQIAAARLSWRSLSRACPHVGQANTYAALARESAQAERGGSLLACLRSTEAEARPGLVENFIAAQVASVFGIDAEKVDRDISLTSVGLDSLMALELANRLQREVGVAIPMTSLLGGPSIKVLAQTLLQLLAQSGPADQEVDPAQPRPAATPAPAELRSSNDPYLQILSPAESERVLARARFDGAALAYLPDKIATVGRLSDAQLRAAFGSEPFVSHYYETSLGRIGICMLPFRSPWLLRQDEVRAPIIRAIELARRCGAGCVSLTGLIPSMTSQGHDVAAWMQGRGTYPVLTTGHATTTAALVRNLEQMLEVAGRPLDQEALAVLGLGSIGQSCLRLLLEVCPHPRKLVLCDVFAKERLWQNFSEVLRKEHGYQGPIRLASSVAGAPAEVYEAGTILTAVSVPDVLDVGRLRPGTLVVDDSYPPAFSVRAATQRLEADGDIFFSNAGMLRLPAPIRETVLVPAGAEGVLEHFGVAAFREEVLRDPHELTACVLSSLLTGRPDGAFPPTLGLAELTDLVGHYRELAPLDIGPARPQCDNYFMPEEAVEHFRRQFGGQVAVGRP
jgi:acyl transferase domain-containing protein/acyl carrier protein